MCKKYVEDVESYQVPGTHDSQWHRGDEVGHEEAGAVVPRDRSRVVHHPLGEVVVVGRHEASGEVQHEQQVDSDVERVPVLLTVTIGRRQR